MESEEVQADCWQPNPGPQERFLSCGAFECLYGGRAGGGKTIALVLDSLRRVTMPRYAALLLRRTVPELKLSKGLLENAWNIFPGVGGTPRDGGMTWFWENAGGLSRIDLRSIDNPQDVVKFQGAEYHHIAFDEATTFTGPMYRYMFSRLRSTYGIPTRLRGATNPGSVGHDFFVDRFAPWLRLDDDEYEGERAFPGQRLAYRYDKARDDLVRCELGDKGARSRTYFPASYEDTPQVGAEYIDNLNQLDALTRARLRDGNWAIRPSAGLMFRSEWFKKSLGTRVAHRPVRVKYRCRAWDFAATATKEPLEGQEAKQAATCGVLMSVGMDDRFYIEDVVRLWGRPGQVRAAVKETMRKDNERAGQLVFVSIPQDPGQAGVDQMETYARVLRGGWWHGTPERGDKIERAKPLSAESEHGAVVLVDGEWNNAFLREGENFPFGLKDQIDAASRAHHECLHGPRLVPSTDRNRTPTRETARSTGDY